MAQQGFFIGDSRSELIEVMGEPTEVDAYPTAHYEILRYGPSSVTLVEGSVAGWSNLGGLALEEPDQIDTTTILEPGSSPDAALSKLGAPNIVYQHGGRMVWSYGGDSLAFKDGRLIEWTGGDRLGVVVPVEPNGHTHIEVGMTEHETLQLLGTPDKVRRYELSQTATMSWGRSTVVFDNRMVLRWVNGGNLPVPLAEPTEPGGSLALGDAEDHVVSVMGSPDRKTIYEMLDRELWGYGPSQITLIGKVLSGWVDRGQLRLKPTPASGGELMVTEGSTQDQILTVHGTPDAILVSSLRDSTQTWLYHNDSIFLENGVLVGWRSRGRLSITLGDAEGALGPPAINDSKSDVIRKLGTPWSLQKYPLTEREIWSWQDASVVLKQGKVEKIIRAPVPSS